MIWLMALMMLASYGLAVCTIGGMVTNGINTSLAMATGALEVIIGVIIARAMYRHI
ncbi:hypothetical protein ACFLUO_09785 [Chloroflexota bacterium]